MKLLLLVFVVFISLPGASQTNGLESQVNLESIGAGNTAFPTFDRRDRSFRGSPNLFENFLPGEIQMNSGQKVSVPKMNYDALEDQVVVMRDGREQIVTTSLVRSFYFIAGADTLKFEKHVRDNHAIGFYQKLGGGKTVALYKKYFAQIIPPSKTDPYSSGSTETELVQKQQLYIRDGKDRAREFRNKKTFLELFPTDENTLGKFMKENKIDFKNEKDLVQLVVFLDSIRIKK